MYKVDTGNTNLDRLESLLAEAGNKIQGIVDGVEWKLVRRKKGYDLIHGLNEHGTTKKGIMVHFDDNLNVTRVTERVDNTIITLELNNSNIQRYLKIVEELIDEALLTREKGVMAKVLIAGLEGAGQGISLTTFQEIVARIGGEEIFADLLREGALTVRMGVNKEPPNIQLTK